MQTSPVVFRSDGRLAVFHPLLGLRHHVVCNDTPEAREQLASHSRSRSSGRTEGVEELSNFLLRAYECEEQSFTGVGPFELLVVLACQAEVTEVYTVAIMDILSRRKLPLGRLTVRFLLECAPKEGVGSKSLLRLLSRVKERALAIDSKALFVVELDEAFLCGNHVSLINEICSALPAKCVVSLSADCGELRKETAEAVWGLSEMGAVVHPRLSVVNGSLRDNVRSVQTANQQEGFELDWSSEELADAVEQDPKVRAQEVTSLLEVGGVGAVASTPFFEITRRAFQGRAYALDPCDVTDSILVDSDGGMFASRYHRILGIPLAKDGTDIDSVTDYINAPRMGKIDPAIENVPSCTNCDFRGFCGTYQTAHWHALDSSSRKLESVKLAWQECELRRSLLTECIMSIVAEADMVGNRDAVCPKSQLVFKNGEVHYVKV